MAVLSFLSYIPFIICHIYKLTCPPLGDSVYCLWETWKDFLLVWYSATRPSSPKYPPFQPRLSSILHYDARIRWGIYLLYLLRFFYYLVLFVFFCYCPLLSSIPLFSSKRKLKTAFTKIGGQEGHPKKLGGGKRAILLQLLFSLCVFNPHFTMYVFGVRA